MAEQEQQAAQQPQQTPAPVQPEQSFRMPAPSNFTDDAYFQQDDVQDSTYFEQGFDVFLPKPPHIAAEAGVLTSLLENGGVAGSITQDAETVRRDMEQVGTSAYFDRVMATNTADYNQQVTETLIVPNEELSRMLDANDAEGVGAYVEDVEAEKVASNVNTPRGMAIAQAMETLSPKQQEYFAEFSATLPTTLYAQGVDSVLNEGMSDAADRAGVLDWLGALLNPVQGITSRADQTELGEHIAAKLGRDLDINEYVFKPDHLRMFDEFLDPEKLTQEQMNNRLEELKTVISQANERDDINPVYTMELLDWVQYTFNNSRLPEGAYAADVLDATEYAPGVAILGRALRGLSRWAGVRLFGRAGAASNKLTPADVDEISMEVQGIVEQLNPNPRIQEIKEALPRREIEVQDEYVEYQGEQVRLSDLQTRQRELEDTAIQKVSRKERKALEEEKKKLAKDISAIESRKNLQAETKIAQQGGRVSRKNAERIAGNRIQEQVAPLKEQARRNQQAINQADQIEAGASEYARIDQALRQAPRSAVARQVPGPVSEPAVLARRPRPGSGSLASALNNGRPLVFRTLMGNALKNDTEAPLYFGMSKENFAQQFVPDPLSKEKGMHRGVLSGTSTNREGVSQYDSHYPSGLREKFNEAYNETNSIDLLTPAERSRLVDQSIETIAQNSRGTLHTDSVEVLDTVNGGINVRAVFGASVDGGYPSWAKAKNAGKFLFGEEYDIVAKAKGIPGEMFVVGKDKMPDTDALEYYVRADLEVAPSGREVGLFDDAVFMKMPGYDYLQTWSRRLSKDLGDSISSFADKGNRLAVVLTRMLNPVLRLKSSNKNDWIRLLMHGDENQMEFTRLDAQNFLGRDVDDNLWDAYLGTREFYDSMARIRQKSVYTTLKGVGYRSVYGKGGILQDQNGKIHARPLPQRADGTYSRTGSRPDEVPLDSNDIWGKVAYDVTKGELVDITDELLEELSGGSSNVVARTSRPAEFTDDMAVDFIIAPATDFRPLTRQPMSIRKGHVDLNYKGEDSFFQKFVRDAAGIDMKPGGNSWRVTEKVQRNIGGEVIDDTRTVAIAGSRDEAIALQRQLEAENLDEGAESPYQAGRTREGSFELGLDSTGTFSNLPAHARGRGERLRGPSGQAEIESIEDSLSKAVGEVRRLTGTPVLEVQRQRWMNTYKEWIRPEALKDGFPRDYTDTIWKRSDPDGQPDAPATVLSEARTMHRSIQNFERSISGKNTANYMRAIRQWADGLVESKGKGSTWKRNVGKDIRTIADSNLGNTLQQVTAAFFIAARPAYQMLANTYQSAFLFVQNPARFTAQTLPRAIVTMAGLSARRLGMDDKAMDAMAKAFGSVSGDFGMTGKQFQDYLDSFRKSGVFSTSLADDIYSVLTEGAAIEAGRHNLTSGAFWKRMLPGGGVTDRVGRGLMIPQKATTDLTNFMAYVHASNRVIADKGIGAFAKADNVNKVAADTRRLTFNQNRADQFAYQQNVLGIQLQFIQHVHRMWNDMIADPVLRTATGNKLKMSADGTNLYAQGWAQSVFTLAGLGAMFGTEWMLPDEYENSFRKSMEKSNVPKEAISLVMDGYVGLAMESMFGEKIASEGRLSPIGMLNSTVELMFTNDGGLSIGGPTGALWEMFGSIGTITKAYFQPEGLEWEQATRLLSDALPKMASGFRDWEKAQVAWNLEEARDASGRKLADVNPDYGWAALLSLPLEEVEERYNTLDDIYKTKDLVRSVAKNVNGMVLSELNNYPRDEITGDMIAEEYVKAIQLARLMVPDTMAAKQEVADELTQMAILPGEGFLAQYAEMIFNYVPVDKAVLDLRKLKEKHPESQAFFDDMINYLEEQRENGEVQ